MHFLDRGTRQRHTTLYKKRTTYGKNKHKATTATNKNQFKVKQNEVTEPAATWAKRTVRHILFQFTEFSTVEQF